MTEAVCIVIKNERYFVKDMDMLLFKKQVNNLGIKYSKLYHASYLCSDGVVKMFETIEDLKKHLGD